MFIQRDVVMLGLLDNTDKMFHTSTHFSHSNAVKVTCRVARGDDESEYSLSAAGRWRKKKIFFSVL